MSGKGDFEQRLIAHFPSEEKAIMEFINLMKVTVYEMVVTAHRYFRKFHSLYSY